MNASDSFYLAIRRSELGQRWFLSTSVKTLFPADVAGGAHTLIGMRVVTLKVQNGKLYVFDADDRKARSDLFAPELLVEAWPIVKDHPLFNLLPNASEYVLFDPAAGLNRFGVMDEREVIVSGAGRRFEVELSFAQRARVLGDGVAYDQVVMGFANALGAPQTPDQRVDRNPFRAVLLNVDGVRSMPSRRAAVDVLKKLQSYEALAILREAHAELVASLPLLTRTEKLAVDDLARRIDAASSPYFL